MTSLVRSARLRRRGTPRSWVASNWRLQVPEDLNLDGAADSVEQPALASYSSAWFQVSADGAALVMRARVDGVTTTGSSYPRCELRELTSTGATAGWSLNDGKIHQLTVSGKVLHMPPVRKRIILGQLHNGSTDLVSVLMSPVSGLVKIAFQVNGVEQTPVLTADYVVGTAYTYRLQARGDGTIRMYWNDMVTPKFVASGLTDTALNYMKAGAYVLSNTTYDVASEYGEVEIRNLTLFTI